MAQHNAPQKLTDLLIAKNFDVKSLDAAGQPATDPSTARVFNFNWESDSGRDYGTVVIMIGENNDLTVYTGDNVGKSMESADKNDWFKFLEQIRMFAKKNLMTFSVQNLNKLKYSQQGQAAMKEGLHESWIGRRDRSWNGGPTEARLMIKHKRVIGENEARYRYIESLFIETADGERFRLPFTKLAGGKAMLEHVKQGGRTYDPRGNHIASMVNEMNLLARFRRANQGKIFEGEAATLVEQAEHHYANLRRNLKSLGTPTGYSRYFESWDPAALTDEDVIIEDLRCMFVEQNIDSRIEQALPLLAKLQKQENAMKEIGIFEGWINCLSEGTWALPDTPEKQQKLIKLLSDELPVGPDATNATELLYDLIGDDDLFDQLHDLAREDANADARTIVINKLEQMASNPAVAQVIGKLKVEKQAPPPEAPAEPVSEDQICEVCSEAVCECGTYESVDDEIQQIAELGGTGFQRVFHNGQWVDPKKIPPQQPQQVKELSPDTLKSYIKKAGSSSDERSASNLASRAGYKMGSVDYGDGEDSGEAEDHKSYLRSKGIARAVDRLEELSSDTLKSYIKKASSDRAMRNFDQGVDMGQSMHKREPDFGSPENSRKDDSRRKGIHKAVNRLEEGQTKEEMWRMAERMSLKDFLERYGNEDWVEDFWRAINDEVERIQEGGTDWADYERRVAALEKKGLSRSDAQGVVDAEMMQNKSVDSGAWSDEGEWKKIPRRHGKPVDPRGEVTHMSDVARRKTASMKEDEMDETDAAGALSNEAKSLPADYKVLKKLAKQWQNGSDTAYNELQQLGWNISDDRKGVYIIKQTDMSGRSKIYFPELTAETVGGGNWLEEGELNIGDRVKCPNGIVGEIVADEGDRWIVVDAHSEFDDDQLEFRKSDCVPLRRKGLKETTALQGQYGHSGRLEAYEGSESDPLTRMKSLAGILVR